jgi:hypothetical protein
MKIYIATPVNARREETLEEKRLAAYNRMCEIRKQIHAKLPNTEFHSSFDEHIAPINKECWKSETMIMGECVTEVMKCDMIVLDWDWARSKGCMVEKFTALQYDKEVKHAYELEINAEKHF